tara:strand:+ start:172 stop:435 length:264 start_codon:yes stop_codon:yes gene_type:complete
MKFKKTAILAVVSIGMFSCASYTEDQGKAAEDFCECMGKAESGDFDIDFFECTMAQNEAYDNELFADEGYGLALDEKCPDIAAKITE